MGQAINTPPFRASYVKVLKAAPNPSGDLKYSIMMLFPKESTDFKKMKAAVDAAIAEKWGNKVPKGLRKPFRDGDEEDGKGAGTPYEGMIFVNASSDNQPGIVDRNMEDIVDPEEIYSGMWCRANISFFGYDTAGNRGVGVGLNHIQKLKDDDHIDGRIAASAAFDDGEQLPEDDTTEDDEMAALLG